MTPGTIILLLFALFVVFIVAKGLRIVQQSEAMVIERLGKYQKTLNAGINVIIPIVDKPREIISRFTRDLPDGNKYVQFIKKERIDLRESVFDAYVRGTSATTRPGSGVGLFLVRTFAQLHGGRAWWEPSALGGSRFVVSLPQ